MEENPQPYVTLAFSINHIPIRCWFQLFGWIKSPAVPYLSQYLLESPHIFAVECEKRF